MTVQIPDRPEALRKCFADALRMAGAMHRVVIILDGLNQLDDNDQAPDLVWLPRDLPPKIRLITSTLPGRPLDEIGKRGWPTLELAPLRLDERERLIVDYLAQYAKALARSQIAMVAEAPMASNPLFLVALLEELRVWGVYETLENQIQHYLAAATIGDLFQRILARYEGDYDRERPGLVRDALSAIWAARHGLSEAELLDLLGHDGAQLPRAYWSPLYLAAERSLVSHSGLLGYFHDYLRQAVRERYLPTEAQQRDAHLRLADYFGPRELNPRKAAELPWQLAQAQEWQRLAGVLADLLFVRAAWGDYGYEVVGYWSKIDEHIPGAPVEAYKPAIDVPTQKPQDLYLVSLLLSSLNYPRESVSIQVGLINMYLRGFKPGGEPLSEEDATFAAEEIVKLSIEAADNLRVLRDFDTAMVVIRRAVEVGRHEGNREGLTRAIAHEGIILLDQDKCTEAKQLFNEAEALARTIDNKSLLAMVLGNQAALAMSEDPTRALAAEIELEQLIRETGDKRMLSACIVNQGNALTGLGNLDAALKKFEEGEQLSREIGSMQGVCVSLWYQCLVFVGRQDGEGALKLLAQHEAICRRIDDKKNLALSLRLQAEVTAVCRHDMATATKLLVAHEQLCHELGDKLESVRGWLLQANFFAQQNDTAGSLAALEKAETILRELGDKTGLANCLADRALQLEASGRAVEAMQTLKEAEGLYRELSNFEALARAIFDQAKLFSLTIRMPAAAMPGMRQAQELAEAHGLSSLAQEIKQYADGISGPAN